jgi:tetratricopeptide (TPR) repeat protein
MVQDICTNLAHVYLLQKRTVEAERLYQATIRSLSRSGRSAGDQPAQLNEWVGAIQLRSARFEEASRSVLRALHLNPANLRAWYNFAFVGYTQATAVLAKFKSTAAAVEDARAMVQVSKRVFKHLTSLQQPANARQYDRKFAGTNYATSQVRTCACL